MPMHTWRKLDGTYYDDISPESPEDEALPLRPSLVHHWNGRQWIWVGKNITHSVPRESDCRELGLLDLKSILGLLHEALDIQDYHSRTLESLRQRVAEDSFELHKHVQEAEPLMQALSDLQKLARLSSLIGRVLVRVWRLLVWGVALSGVMWALFHGDVSAFKRAWSLLSSL